MDTVRPMSKEQKKRLAAVDLILPAVGRIVVDQMLFFRTNQVEDDFGPIRVKYDPETKVLTITQDKS